MALLISLLFLNPGFGLYVVVHNTAVVSNFPTNRQMIMTIALNGQNGIVEDTRNTVYLHDL